MESVEPILIFGIFSCQKCFSFRWQGPKRCAPLSDPCEMFPLHACTEILAGVRHKHRTLDEQLDGAAAHPGLKALSDRDRALMRRLVATILRRLGTLGPLF